MKTCSICSHPERAAIDAALVSGQSLRDIASGRNGTTRSALDRHRKHIPAALTKAKQAEEVAEATTLLSRVERLRSRCETLFDGASQAKKWAGAAAAVREMRGCLELIGKLSGELKQGGFSLSIRQSFANLSIKDFTDQQVQELEEILSERFDSQARLKSNEDIEARIASILGVDGLEYLMPEVTFTQVERLIRAGFDRDSKSVQEALKKKEAEVKAYLDSQAPVQAIEGVR